MTVTRSPADVLRLVVAAVVVIVLLLVEWLFGNALVEFASDLLRGLDAVPQWIVDVVVIGTRVLQAAVLGGGLVWIVYHRRWRMLVTVVAAGVLAVVVFAALDALVGTDRGGDAVRTESSLGLLTSDGFTSTAAVTAVAGILTAAAPWLSRRWRKAGWLLIVGMASVTFLNAGVSFAAGLALATGWLCGAAVLVVGGAPSRRPTSEAIIAGLGAVGLPVVELERAGVDARGSTPYFGVAADGTKLFVKALGDDERSADLLFRLYRGIQPHDLGDERPFDSMRRSVEHEAFVALTASSLGVRTPAPRAFATAEPNAFVLAYEAIEGKSLDRLDPDELTDEVLAEVWALVGQLRGYRLAHRDLRLANIFLDDDGRAWMIDFGFSEVSASDLLLATDVAELIASSSPYVGADRAVAHAVRSVDAATLTRAVDRLHRWGLSGATRTALKERPGLLDDLRSRLAEAASVRVSLDVNFWWLIPAGVGLVIVALSVLGARHPVISPTEARVFHAINGLPDGLYPWLWLPMQLGNLVVGTAAGLLIAVLDRDITVAIGAVLVMGLKLVLERIVRREVADYLAVRQRPGTSQVGAILRGDVPSSGPSFPSGHVILTAGIATLVTPILPGVWWWVPIALTGLVTIGRVYVGAHNPLDVIAGLGAGLFLGSLVAVLVD